MGRVDSYAAASSLASTDVFFVETASGPRKVTQGTVRDDVRSQSRWNVIPSSRFTATPPTTSTVTFSNTTGIVAGMAIRINQGSGYLYGVVHSVTANTSITVHGAALSTGAAITSLEIGDTGSTVLVEMFISGVYGTTTSTAALAAAGRYERWLLREAALVEVRVVHGTAAGTTQPKVNVRIDGNRAMSLDTNLGLQLSTAGTWVTSGAASMNTTNYTVERGEALEIEVSAARVGTDPSNLTVLCLFVLK